MVRSLVLAAALLSGSAAIAQVQERTTNPPGATETMTYAPDRGHRMTVSVNIGGQGPYRFIVDTGAERTVISRELATQLGLAAGADVEIASITQISRVPSVRIPELEVGRRTLSGIEAPALAEANIGAHGMLGVDSLNSQRVVFDFTNQNLTLSASHIADDYSAPGEIVVRGRTRLGRLVVTDASVDGQRITVIIDTGSQITVGNAALRRELERRRRLGETRVLGLSDVTGQSVNADYTVARRLRIGGVYVTDLPIAFSEARLFYLLNLSERPAILLGMDALRAFERVSIDFANRRVRLAPPLNGIAPTMQFVGNSGGRLVAAPN